MKFPGLLRIKIVYPLWTIVYLAFFAIMIFLNIKIPLILLLITLAFSLKTLMYDYHLLQLKRKLVYWLEHGPFLFLVVLLWAFSISITLLQGYVTSLTAIIALIGFALDLWKDMKENPKVYK